MGKVIAIVNQKGGVGKTTCTYNIAASLAKRDRKVLMIDWDYQASLTMSCGYRVVAPIDAPDTELTDFGGYSVENLLQSVSDDVLLDSCFQIRDLEEYYTEHPRLINICPNIDLMPGSPGLTLYETSVQKINSRNVIHNLQVLRDYYHYILIDCTPSLGTTSTSALEATDYVVIPVQPEALDASGLTFLRLTIDAIKHKNQNLSVLGIVLNRYRAAVKHHYEYLISFSHIPDWPLLGVIRESSYVTRALSLEEKGIPCVVDSASSQPTIEFEGITDKIIELVEGES